MNAQANACTPWLLCFVRKFEKISLAPLKPWDAVLKRGKVAPVQARLTQRALMRPWKPQPNPGWDLCLPGPQLLPQRRPQRPQEWLPLLQTSRTNSAIMSTLTRPLALMAIFWQATPAVGFPWLYQPDYQPSLSVLSAFSTATIFTFFTPYEHDSIWTSVSCKHSARWTYDILLHWHFPTCTINTHHHHDFLSF